MGRVGSDLRDLTAFGGRGAGRQSAAPAFGGTYAALDLGTNNCRLLIARQAVPETHRGSFRIVDSFCRIVRLGEGVATSGVLSAAAMERTLAALSICRGKMEARQVTRARLIATEACRAARNSAEFVARVERELDLRLEVIDQKTEALLAAAGCVGLADPDAEGVLLFDIGGGSSELVWIDRAPDWQDGRDADAHLASRIKAWHSLSLGVVTLAEKFGGRIVAPDTYDAMIAEVDRALEPFVAQVAALGPRSRFHLLGTSGTVTTLAGVHLDLPRYDRRKVDGLWLSQEAIFAAIATLRGMSFEHRVTNPCIGPDRADLVLAGCAVFEAIHKAFPSSRVRVADRGLREGLLMQMIAADTIPMRAC